MKNYRLFFAASFLFYSILTTAQQVDYRVHFRYDHVVFPENCADFIQKNQFLPAEIIDGKVVRFVQFYQIPTTEAQNRMAAEGFQLTDYVSFATWRVVFSADLLLDKLANWNIRAISPVELKWKISRSLTDRPLGDWAVSGDKVRVVAQTISTISNAQAERLFQKNNLKIIKNGHQNGIFDLEIAISEIEKVADLPFLKWLEIQSKPGVPEDTHGRSMHRANMINTGQSNGLNFDGAGLAVLTRDDGAVGPHIDFTGRIINISTDFGVFNGHGDGTGGILAGAGNLDPTQKGMASGAQLFVTDYVSDFLDTTLALHQQFNVKVTNTSYSDGCNDGYNTHSQTVDQQLFENSTLMHSFSAGNAGGSDCNFGAGGNWGNITGGHKQSKNGLASANLQYNFVLEPSSSRGPASDGRIKPDLAAHGQNQGSTDNDNTYQVFGGTSAASPGTAGVCAQLFGAFKATHNGQEPDAALIKAAMLNSANDLGNIGPDFQFGWGHLNAFRAFNLLKNNQFLTGSVSNGQLNTHVLQVPANLKQLKVMLYWADPEGDLSADRALVNDLDFKLNEPLGAQRMPFVLNPFPDPITLDLPAISGADHLNNMEQIALNSPSSGAYLLSINGFEIPTGAVKYYIVWEYLADEITVTYPSGGEGFVPGEMELIHWDAFGQTTDFKVEYSKDNGISWANIGNTPKNQPYFEWQVPSSISPKAKIRVSSGGISSVNNSPFSIIGLIDTILATAICPDSMTISWPVEEGAVGYQIYRLGQKFMDSIGVSSTNSFTFSINNPLDQKWVSVSPIGQGGLLGRRRVAIPLGGGLLNCPQPRDVAVVKINEPASGYIVACQPILQPISVKIINEGLNLATNFPISYRFGNNPIVTELFSGSLNLGESADFTFAQPLNLSVSKVAQLEIFTALPNESANYNDTIRLNVSAVVNSGIGVGVREDFEANFLPDFWALENPDGQVTWTRATDIIGISDNVTAAARVNMFSYEDTTAVDYLISPPFNLINLNTPLLVFDYSYARYNDLQYFDCLRVEIINECGAGIPQTIWAKCQDDLSTSAPTSTDYTPSSGSDWQQQLVDISAFSGQKVAFRFVCENGYGNNLYLDNIGIINEVVDVPFAAFSSDADTICRGDSVVFSNFSTGGLLEYSWSFGQGAQPNSAFTPGPHKVKYPTSGAKTVSLTAFNGFGESVENKLLVVRPLPTANFTVAVLQNTVNFTNTTTNGISYLWDFGDGTTSTDPAPTHQYLTVGSYLVSLVASNNCGANTKTKTANITTVSTFEPTNEPAVQIFPNPNNGEFMLSFNRSISENSVQVILLDITGRQISRTQIAVNQALTSYSFSEKQLPKGIYQVVLQSENWQKTLKMVVGF